jgi:enoyl-CoA hydratase/carnithine racemase
MMANGMEKYATISVEAREDVEILSLNRPDAPNAVTPAMIDELTEYFSGLHQRLTTRVVILKGNGRAFCAGTELGSEHFPPREKGGRSASFKCSSVIQASFG